MVLPVTPGKKSNGTKCDNDKCHVKVEAPKTTELGLPAVSTIATASTPPSKPATGKILTEQAKGQFVPYLRQ